MLIKSAFVKRLLPFLEGVFVHDSWMSSCSRFENKIVYMFDAITEYRQHGNNITFSMHNKKKRCVLNKDGLTSENFSFRCKNRQILLLR